MKIIKYFLLIFITLSAFSHSSYGCSCIGTNFIDKSNSALRKYYNNFKGAIFTGKVLSVETIEFDEGFSLPSLKKKLTVEVDKYWFGIKNRKVTVFTGFGSGDCETHSEKGETYLFIAGYDNEKQLWTGLCDYSIYAKLNKKEIINRFTEILGKPKVFK